MIKHIELLKPKELHKFTLRFKDEETEKLFLADYIRNTLSQSRLAILIACFAFVAFYYHDSILMPEQILELTLVRFGIIIPLAISIYWLTFKPFFLKHGITIMSVCLFIGGSITIIFLSTNRNTSGFSHFNDMIYIFIFAFVLLKITFFNALIVTTQLLILFQIVIVYIKGDSFEEILNANYYVVFSFLFGAIAGYTTELLSRKEFMNRRVLETEKDRSYIEAHNLEKLVQDRTKELMKLNKALKKAKLRAEGSERLKSAFLANISHEIRTPLTQIIGFSELIAKAKISDEKRTIYLNYLDKNSNKLLQIISDIIKLSEIESNEFQIKKAEFQLKAFLKDIEQIGIEERDKNKKNHIDFSIITDGLDPDFTIFSDKANLRQIFINLINNAFKFTHEGEIIITYRIRTDNLLEFCIKDTGVGIDPENTEMIFDHFTQEDGSPTREFGGTGLGLSISKGIVQRMGGKIWVQSEKNIGSSFYFTTSIVRRTPRNEILSNL